jgi:hypothetical protein
MKKNDPNFIPVLKAIYYSLSHEVFRRCSRWFIVLYLCPINVNSTSKTTHISYPPYIRKDYYERG